MKTSIRRVLALLLLLSLVLPILAACGGGNEPEDTTTPDITTAGPTTTSPTTPAPATPAVTAPPATPPVSPAPSELRAIEGLEDYVIVYPEIASDEIVAAANDLSAAIAEKTGKTLPVRSDAIAIGGTVPSGTKEILLGGTNRYESAGNVNVRERDFYVAFKDGRLALMAGGEEALLAAISFAKETLLSDGALSYVDGGYHHAESYILDTLTLLGRPINDFVIVRDAGSAAIAEYLRATIRKYTGYSLIVRTAESAEVPYEILIGDTGRVATNTLPSGKQAVIETAGSTKLALYGSGLDAGYKATVHFINTYLDGRQAVLSVERELIDNSAVGLYALNFSTTLDEIVLENQENTTGVLERFLKAKAELPEEITVLEPFTLVQYPLSAVRCEVYVATDGNDENPGTKEAPVATLERALNIVGRGGGVIWVRGGHYQMNSSVVITGAYSGTRTSPLFIKAYPEETPVFSTYKEIKNEWFDYMPWDDPMIDRFDEDVDTSAILVCDLAEYGFTKADLTEIVSTSDAYDTNGDGVYRESRFGVRPMLLIGDTEYELCRYPNADEEPLSYALAYEMGRVTSSTGSEIYYPWLEQASKNGIDPMTPIGWAITLGTRTPNEYKSGVACERTADWDRYAPILDWVDTGNIWFYGRPYSDWDVGCFNVHVGKKVDENGEPTGEVVHYGSNPTDYAIISTMPSALGARTTSSANHAHHFYLFNAIEALDIPGEWFIDTESESLRMYLYPTDEFDAGEDISYTSGGVHSIVVISGNVSNIIFDGLTFKGTGANGITTSGINSDVYSDIVVQNCNFSHVGSRGVALRGGKQERLAVIYNTFSQAQEGMLALSSNYAYSLQVDSNVIQNNTFYNPLPNHQNAIAVGGVRTVVSHNFLHNTNIQLGGPCYESIIEYNRLVGGSEDVGDGGQIYMYGLYTRGNHIRYNVMEGLNYSGNNIYNDGMCSGNYSYYNICSCITGYRDTVQKGFYVSTGHNNVSYNNLFLTRTGERYEENLALHGKPEPRKTTFEVFDHELGGITKVTRVKGDCAIYESTLFYADLKDPGYRANEEKGEAYWYEDAASYSWDTLYRQAAGIYTGNRTNAYIDLEMMEKRFPNWMAAMRGAQDLFDKMDEMDAAALENDDPSLAYDRRTDVVAMQEAYNAKVAELIEGGATETEAHNEAFRLGLGYCEDFFRQPAYNLYKNNVVVSGDADFYFDTNMDGIYGNSRADFVYSDYLGARGGVDDFGNALSAGTDPHSRDLRIIENNIYFEDMYEVFYDPDPEYWDGFMYYPDYTMDDIYYERVLEVIPDYVNVYDVTFMAGLSDQ